MIRVGVGGWTYEPWRGTFYPAGLKHAEELAYASRHLTTIEINGTFYRTQSAASFAKWRDETTGLESAAALRLLIDRICAPAETSKQDSINRGLTFYNDHLAETLPSEYARVLSPLHQLIQDILNRGIAEGTFRSDLDVESTAALTMQTALGAMRLRVLGAELNGVPLDANHIYDFCTNGLTRDGHPL